MLRRPFLLQVRLSARERELLRAVAAREQLSVSELVRWIVCDRAGRLAPGSRRTSSGEAR